MVLRSAYFSPFRVQIQNAGQEGWLIMMLTDSPSAAPSCSASVWDLLSGPCSSKYLDIFDHVELHFASYTTVVLEESVCVCVSLWGEGL